jgi:hypothetical protein
MVNSRPASVALIVVVPARPTATTGLATVGRAVVLHRTANSLDLETPVDIDGHVASRVDVRLGPAWSDHAARVWVRNRGGELERLGAGTLGTVVDALRGSPGSPPTARFRIETDRPLSLAALTVPVEYHVRVGSGERAAVWIVRSLLRVDAAR